MQFCEAMPLTTAIMLCSLQFSLPLTLTCVIGSGGPHIAVVCPFYLPLSRQNFTYMLFCNLFLILNVARLRMIHDRREYPKARNSDIIEGDSSLSRAQVHRKVVKISTAQFQLVWPNDCNAMQ